MRTQLAHLPQLVAEVFHGEAVFLDLLLKFQRLLLVDNLFRFLDQRHDVAHAHDSRHEPIGMEELERVVLFAGSDKLYRLSGDLLDGKGGAAAGIAVHFGEDESVEAELLVKLLRAFDGVLSEHGVGNEQNFVRLDRVFDLAKFLHQRFVNVQASGGIDDEHVVSGVAGFAQGVLAQSASGLSPGFAFPDLHADVACNHLQLLPRRRPIDVDGNQHWTMPVFREPFGQAFPRMSSCRRPEDRPA